jgi:hypothetical protein
MVMYMCWLDDIPGFVRRIFMRFLYLFLNMFLKSAYISSSFRSYAGQLQFYLMLNIVTVFQVAIVFWSIPFWMIFPNCL